MMGENKWEIVLDWGVVPGLVGRFRDTTVPMETEDGEPAPLLGGQAIRTESESAAHHSGHGKAMK